MTITRVWWNWESDDKFYPTWHEFVQNLRDEHNIRTLSYINPFLANVSTKSDGFDRNLFAEAAHRGYMIQNATTNSTSIISSGPGISAGILDLTNPNARSWFVDTVLRQQVWSANISGFMCDFGEYTPVKPDTGLFDSDAVPRLYHNKYPYNWAAMNHHVANSVRSPSEELVFHRSAALGANKNMNLFWAGDQTISWQLNDGIKSAITIMGHMGISGYAHSHSDVGGYTNMFEFPSAKNPTGVVNRTAELLGRWGEMAAVSSSAFRSHEGNIPQVNAQFYTDNATYKYYAYNAKMFHSLGPYRRQILRDESEARGWPLLRMPVLVHPDDARARQISHESFYLGSDLYVAPVLNPGQMHVEAYFPGSPARNSYRHVWSGKTYHGGQTVKVEAPYGKPAVFVVNGAKNPNLDRFLEFVRQEKDTVVKMD